MALTPKQLDAAKNRIRAAAAKPEDKRKIALAAKLAKNREIKRSLYKRMHAGQRRAYKALHSGTYTSLCGGRRGGKTDFDADVITEALIESGRDEWTIFIAETAQVGKELIWSELVKRNEQYALGWDMREHPIANITTPAGAKFKIVGCDNAGELDKLRGKKYRLVVIDEAKDVEQHLRELIYEVLGAAFMNVGGKVLVSGTPGRVCDESDFWYAITHAKEDGSPIIPGWRTVHFTIRENPWFKDPEAALAKVRADNEWEPDNVIYLREYEGLWISDDGERVYPYLATRNSIQGLPRHYNRDKWTHVMGIDFGVNDACAWVVWACHPNERDVYAVHAEKHVGLLPEQAADTTAVLVERFRPSSIVGDSGGLGKPYVVDFNRRHAEKLKTWIKPAEKQGKRAQIEILAGEIKSPGSVAGKSRVLVCLPMAAPLAHEWTNLGWKDSRREVEHPRQPNHASDAGLYGHRELRAYYNKPAPSPQNADQREAEALRDRQRKARQRQQGGFFRRLG